MLNCDTTYKCFAVIPGREDLHKAAEDLQARLNEFAAAGWKYKHDLEFREGHIVILERKS